MGNGTQVTPRGSDFSGIKEIEEREDFIAFAAKMEENWVYQMMASMNSKQFEENPTNPTVESSVAEVSKMQQDAEKVFHDSKKVKNSKGRPTRSRG